MGDWRNELSEHFTRSAREAQGEQEKRAAIQARVDQFYREKVTPALEEVRAELEKHGKQVEVHGGSITVKHEGMLKYRFSVEVRQSLVTAHAFPRTMSTDSTGQRYTAEGFFRSGVQDYTVDDLTKEEIIRYLIRDYTGKVGP